MNQKSYCRLCAKLTPEEKLSNLQTDEANLQMVLEKLNVINVTLNFDNNLPKNVCIPCFRSLETAVEFVETVKTAQNILQDIFSVKNDTELVHNTQEKGFDTLEIKYELPIELGSGANISLKSEIENSNESKLHDFVRTNFFWNKIEILQNSCSTDINVTNENEIENSLDHESDQSENTNISKADVCDKTFGNWQNFDWMCSCCETLFPTVDDLQSHSMEVHSKCNAYKCTVCGKRRHNLNEFLKHVYTHKKYLKLSCHKCFLTLPTGRELRTHRQTHITSNFVCVGCNTSFTSSDHLEMHKSKFHSLIRLKNPVIQKLSGLCNICHNNFKNLTAHMSTHAVRSRSHTCEMCGKSYFTKESLAQHFVTHKVDKPYECQICKQSFKTKTSLLSHVVLHNDIKLYSCDQCEKSYHKLKYLNEHKKIHTDIWYECDTCQRSYKRKAKLITHIKITHKGIIPYNCVNCQRNFNNYATYFAHMKKTHSIDIRRKKVNAIDAKTLQWKQDLIAEKTKRGRKVIIK